MKSIVKFFIKFNFLLLILSEINFLSSLEIPTHDFTVIRIGVVDMNQVISEYPNAQKQQQEIELFRQNKLSEVVNLEKEIEDLVKQKISLTTEIEQLKTQVNQISITTSTTVSKIEVSTSSLETLSLQISTLTATVSQDSDIVQINSVIQTKEDNLKQIEESLSSKRQQLQTKKEEIENEVQRMKDKAEANMYAELYKIIQQVAKHYGLNIVIEKSGILYGDVNIDITQEVIRKFK